MLTAPNAVGGGVALDRGPEAPQLVWRQKLEHRAHAVWKVRAMLAPADNDRICVLQMSDDRLVVVRADGIRMRAQERGVSCSKGEEVDDSRRPIR